MDNPVGVMLSASVSGTANFLVCFGCVGTATGAKEKNGYKSEEKSRNQENHTFGLTGRRRHCFLAVKGVKVEDKKDANGEKERMNE